MAKKREATSLLAVERRRRGWSQAIVVDRMYHAARVRNLPPPTGLNVNYVSKWERGINQPDRYHAHLLCLVFELPSNRLGLPGDVAPPVPTVAEGENDTERREFLKRLGGALGGTIAAGEWAKTLALPADLTDEPDLDRLRLRTDAYGRQVHTDVPRDLLLLLHAHLVSLQGMFGDRHGTTITRELQRLASETATVAGYICYRLQNYGDAEAYFARADKLAVEAGDGPLRALGLVARSALYSPVPHGGSGGDPTTALALLEAAESAAGPGANPLLLTWLYARRVEDYASCQAPLSSDRSMELAERHFHHVQQRDPGFYHNWTPARLIGYRGSAAVLLSRSQQVITVVDAPLRRTPASLASERSFLLIIMASGCAQQGLVDDACALLSEAYDLAERSGLSERVRRIRGTRRKYLDAWSSSQAVRDLDDRLRIR